MDRTTEILILLCILGSAAASAQPGASAGVTAAGAGAAGFAVLPPSDRLRLWAGASRNLSGLATRSTLSAPRSTTLRLDAGYDLARRLRASASFAADVGQADSTQALSRMIGAGAAYTIAGPLMLVIDGGHGLTSSSPRWVLSLGLGTAFASTSLVSPTSPLGRQQSSFGGGVNRGSGSGKTGGCP